jgi:ATP-dependent DNA helicase RecG
MARQRRCLKRTTSGHRLSFGCRRTPLAKQRTADVTVEVATLLQVIHWGVPVPALQAAMGLRNAEHFRKAYLVPAMKADYLEMTLPDTPCSARQRYHLTHLSLQRQRELNGKP